MRSTHILVLLVTFAAMGCNSPKPTESNSTVQRTEAAQSAAEQAARERAEREAARQAQVEEGQRLVKLMQTYGSRSASLSVRQGNRVWSLMQYPMTMPLGSKLVCSSAEIGKQKRRQTEIAMPFDCPGSIVELSDDRFLISGFDTESEIGYLVRFKLDKSPDALSIEASMKLGELDPYEILIRSDEGLIYLRDERREKLLVAPFAGAANTPLPKSEDFTVVLQGEQCEGLGDQNLTIKSNEELLISGVSLFKKGQTGKVALQRIEHLDSGEWVSTPPPVRGPLQPPSKAMAAARNAALAAENERSRTRHETVKRMSEEAMARTGTEYGFIFEELLRGNADALGGEELMSFHQGFLDVYSDLRADSIQDPVSFIHITEEVTTDAFGSETRTPFGEPYQVFVERRFAPKYEEFDGRPLLEEFYEFMAKALTDSEALVKDTMAELLADRRYLTARIEESSDEELERVFENLYRVTNHFAPINDPCTPGLNPDLLLNISGHTSQIIQVIFSPDGSYILARDFGRTDNVKLWDANSGQLRGTLSPGLVRRMAVSPDGSHIAIAEAGSGGVRVWTRNAVELKNFTTGHSQNRRASGICFSQDGKALWIGDDKGLVEKRELATSAVLHEFQAHDFETTDLWPGQAQDALLTAGYEKGHDWPRLRAWDESGTLREALEVLDEGVSLLTELNLARLIHFIPSVRYEISSLREPKSVQQLPVIPEEFISLALSHDGSFAALGGADGTVQLWDLNSTTLLKTFTGHSKGVRSLAFSPNNNLLITGGLDKRLLLWKTGI